MRLDDTGAVENEEEIETELLVVCQADWSTTKSTSDILMCVQGE